MYYVSFPSNEYVNGILFLYLVLTPATTLVTILLVGRAYNKTALGWSIGLLLAIVSIPLGIGISLLFHAGRFGDVFLPCVVSVFVCYIFAHILIYSIAKRDKRSTSTPHYCGITCPYRGRQHPPGFYN